MKAGRTGVEESDVKSAVEALEQEGIRPTLRTIRDRLGRGSLGTIQRHLGALRPRMEATPQSLPEVPDSVMKALGRWAQEAVSVRLAEMQAQLEEQSRAVEALCVDNEAVTAASHDAEEQIGELAKQLESARSDAEVLSTARDTLQHQLGEAERRERALSAELVIAHVRAERADGVELEVARLTGALAECKRAQAVAEASSSAIDARLELMSERLAEQRIQCEMLSESLATTRAELVLEQQRRIAAETKLDTVTRLFDQLVQQVPVRGDRSSEHDCGKQSCDAAEPAS